MKLEQVSSIPPLETVNTGVFRELLSVSSKDIKNVKELTELASEMETLGLSEISVNSSWDGCGITLQYYISAGVYGWVFVATYSQSEAPIIVKVNKGSADNGDVQYDSHLTFYKELPQYVPRPLFYGKWTSSNGTVLDIYGMGLNVYTINTGTFFIIIDQLHLYRDRDLLDFIVFSLDFLLNQMASKFLVHGDFHLNNIVMQTIKGESTFGISHVTQDGGLLAPMIIDFDYSAKYKNRFEFPSWFDPFVLFKTVMMITDLDVRDYIIAQLKPHFNKIPQEAQTILVKQDADQIERIHRDIYNQQRQKQASKTRTSKLT